MDPTRYLVANKNLDPDQFIGDIIFHTGNPKDGVMGFSIESLLAICLHRLQWHNSTPFKCEENSIAAEKISEALKALTDRTNRRIKEGKYGTTVV